MNPNNASWPGAGAPTVYCPWRKCSMTIDKKQLYVEKSKIFYSVRFVIVYTAIIFGNE